MTHVKQHPRRQQARTSLTKAGLRSIGCAQMRQCVAHWTKQTVPGCLA